MEKADSSVSVPAPDTGFIHSLFNSTNDARIAHLSRILTTSSGVDTTLTLVGYSLYFVHAQLNRLQNYNLKVLAERVASNASKSLNPGETVVATFPLPGPMSRIEDLKAATKGLAGMCSDFRAFTRLWGLLAIWAWAKRTYLAPPKDEILKTVAWAQIAANASYLIFENGYYLAGKGVLRGWAPQKQKRWALLSLRMFLGHVALEFVRLWRTRQLREEKRYLGEEKEDKIARIQEEKAWWRTSYIYAAYTPLAVHWAIDGGFLSDDLVGALMTVVGLVKFRAAWKQTA